MPSPDSMLGYKLGDISAALQIAGIEVINCNITNDSDSPVITELLKIPHSFATITIRIPHNRKVYEIYISQIVEYLSPE